MKPGFLIYNTTSGAELGIYPGATPDEAMRAMRADAGDCLVDDDEPTSDLRAVPAAAAFFVVQAFNHGRDKESKQTVSAHVEERVARDAAAKQQRGVGEGWAVWVERGGVALEDE